MLVMLLVSYQGLHAKENLLVPQTTIKVAGQYT
jgi:hypothetical protein